MTTKHYILVHNNRIIQSGFKTDSNIKEVESKYQHVLDTDKTYENTINGDGNEVLYLYTRQYN